MLLLNMIFASTAQILEPTSCCLQNNATLSFLNRFKGNNPCNLANPDKNLYNNYDFIFPNKENNTTNSMHQNYFSNEPFNNSAHNSSNPNSNNSPNNIQKYGWDPFLQAYTHLSNSSPNNGNSKTPTAATGLGNNLNPSFNNPVNTSYPAKTSFYSNNLQVLNPDGKVHHYPNMAFEVKTTIPGTSFQSSLNGNSRERGSVVVTSVITSTIRMPPIVVTSIPSPKTYTKHENPVTTTLPPLIFKIPTTVTKTTKPETVVKTLPPQTIYQPPVTSTIHYRVDHPASTIILSTILPQLVKTILLPGPTTTLAFPQITLTKTSALVYVPHTVFIDRYSAKPTAVNPNSPFSSKSNGLYKLLNGGPHQSIYPAAVHKENFGSYLTDYNGVNMAIPASVKGFNPQRNSRNPQGFVPENMINKPQPVINLSGVGKSFLTSNPCNSTNLYSIPIQQKTTDNLSLENRCKTDAVECESAIAQFNNVPENESEFISTNNKKGSKCEGLSEARVTDEDNEKDCVENSSISDSPVSSSLKGGEKEDAKFVYTSGFVSGRV